MDQDLHESTFFSKLIEYSENYLYPLNHNHLFSKLFFFNFVNAQFQLFSKKTLVNFSHLKLQKFICCALNFAAGFYVRKMFIVNS